MFSLEQERAQEVSLTDAELESAMALEYALDFIYMAEMLERPLGAHTAGLVPSIRFLQKYLCQDAMVFARQALRCWAATNGSDCKQSVFSAAAEFNDITTCAMAIRNGGPHNHFRGEVDPLDLNGPSFAGASIFDLACGRLQYFQLTPPKYMLALLRAQRPYDITDLSKDNWGKIAERFEEIMRNSERSRLWMLTV